MDALQAVEKAQVQMALVELHLIAAQRHFEKKKAEKCLQNLNMAADTFEKLSDNLRPSMVDAFKHMSEMKKKMAFVLRDKAKAESKVSVLQLQVSELQLKVEEFEDDMNLTQATQAIEADLATPNKEQGVEEEDMNLTQAIEDDLEEIN